MARWYNTLEVKSGPQRQVVRRGEDLSFARQTNSSMINGILVVDKPARLTSHDVVARVRRLAAQKRVGHAGTLDPMATGTLVMCLGQATRLAEYLAAHDKAYRAVLRLGIATDTYDAEGDITSSIADQDDQPLPDRETVEQALRHFVGEIMQRPPAFSAIKVGGQPLYRRARRGEKVEAKPRRVTIHRLEIAAWFPPHVTLEVECSAGTYIRSLAHDLGHYLGCGAHLAGLVRTRSGPFPLDQAQSLEGLEAESGGRRWCRHLLPMDAALSEFDAHFLDEEQTEAIVHGRPISGPAPCQSNLARAYSHQDELVAVLEYDEGRHLWQPKKVFHPDSA